MLRLASTHRRLPTPSGRPPPTRDRRSSFFGFRLTLPTVTGDRSRAHSFLGYPHVLAGQRLCIYLGPATGMGPTPGRGRSLNRLWDWLVRRRGRTLRRLHRHVPRRRRRASPRRAEHPPSSSGNPDRLSAHQTACLITRSTHRHDLTYAYHQPEIALPVFTLATALPFGAAATLARPLAFLDDPYQTAATAGPPAAPSRPAS